MHLELTSCIHLSLRKRRPGHTGKQDLVAKLAVKIFDCQPQLSFEMQEIGRWPIFSLLDEEFLTSLRIACVFGSAGNEAIVVTKDDDVYALGSNSSSCLGVGDAQSCLHPRKVEALCKKSVVSLACGSGPHVLAVSGISFTKEK